MSKSESIIKEINSNGGLDMNFIKKSAKLDGTSVDSYLKEYIKSSFNCHGNTANKVVNYLKK